MNVHSTVSRDQQTNMNARSFSEAKWQMAWALLFIYLSTTTTYLQPVQERHSFERHPKSERSTSATHFKIEE
jgi:hypothetical protein